jgi:protein ImuB
LAAVDQQARELGLAIGMTLADARTRVPELIAFDRDELADQRWLERLADDCIRYTPMVALDAPNGLILDITGCAHLWGCEAGLAVEVGQRMAKLGMTMRHAFTCTPFAAHALARFTAAEIRQLPVAALELAPDVTQGLLRAGLKTVGDMTVRPMAGIAARFGSETVTRLRGLLGETLNPITPHVKPTPIRAERRFAEPVTQTEHALEVLGELAVETVRQLERVEAGGRRFEAIFFRSDGLERSLIVQTSQPTRNPALVIRLMDERIEGLSDPIDPGFGFDLIRLSVPSVEPLAAAQLGLGSATRETEIAALIDRLSTRLGRHRVQRFIPQNTHVPEQMQLTLSAIEAGSPTAVWSLSPMGEPPLRPLHLFDPPQPIEVLAEVPDGPPHRFRWRRKQHEVRRFEGPERIASEWWKRQDGAVDRPGLTRDYYRIEDIRGRRFWVFRHGLYEENPDPRWYLHGLFA